MSKTIYATYIATDDNTDNAHDRWKKAFPKPVSTINNINSSTYVKFADKKMSVKSLITKCVTHFKKTMKYIEKNPEEYFQFYKNTPKNNVSAKTPVYKKPEKFTKLSVHIGYDASYNITIFVVGSIGSLEYKQIFVIQNETYFENQEELKFDDCMEEAIAGVTSKKTNTPRNFSPIEPYNSWDRDRGTHLILVMKGFELDAKLTGKRRIRSITK